MWDQIKQHKFVLFQVLILVILFVLIRGLEDYIFYDPLLDFFKGDYQHNSLPEMDNFLLFLGLFFRYGLNTIISLLLLYVIFKEKEIVQFASVLYLIFFVLLIVLFFGILNFDFESKNFLLFYVRRFLIQPLFVILFIPAFYYQSSRK